MTTEIKSAVTELLTAAQITVTVVYRGEQINALGGVTAMDQWQFTFTAKNGKIEQFDFFTGLGLRGAPLQPSYGGPYPKRNILMWERLEKTRKPQKPHPADLLHSLILDSDAIGQSFENWCADFGYDNDSRKAFSTYEACQKNGDKLARVIDKLTLNALREALHDY